MSIRNFIIFTVICVSPLFLIAQEPKTNKISESVKNLANEEKISNSELEKAYAAYKGAYYYGKTFKFRGSEDFGEVFDKMRAVVSDMSYSKNQKLSDLVFEEIKEFEKDGLSFNSENQDKFLEEVNQIAEGLKLAMEKE